MGYKNSITDINGKVGINQPVPTEALDIVGNAIVTGGGLPLSVRSTGTVSYIQIQNSLTGSTGTNDGLTVGCNGTAGYIWLREAASLNIGTNDTSALTIDSSGNATFAGAVTGNAIPAFNVGTIGAIGNTVNDVNIYSTTAGHNGLRMHVNGILPTDNTGTIIDNDADLGDSGYRFKDLYLGGSITAGAATFAGTISSGVITSTGLQVDGGIINYQQGDTYADGLQFLRTGATRANIWLNSANNTLNITRNLGTVGMAIDSSGNVGIGTSPLGNLHVDSTTDPTIIIANPSSNQVNSGKLRFAEGAGAAAYFEFRHDGSANKLNLYSTNTATDIMSWDRITGNVGIGTTSPGAYKLNVAGTGYFSGAVNIAATTQSTSWTTGALVVAGGIGIYKNLFVGGSTTITGAVTASSAVIQSNMAVGNIAMNPESKLVVGKYTTTQRNAILWVAGDYGAIIYNTTDNKFQGYENGVWVNLI